jgi:hypothetical protein
LENLDPFLEKNSFFFSAVAKLTLEHTQPSIKWVFGTLSLRVKRLWHEADCSSPPSAEVKSVCSYIFTFLVYLHVMLTKAQTIILYFTVLYRKLLWENNSASCQRRLDESKVFHLAGCGIT